MNNQVIFGVISVMLATLGPRLAHSQDRPPLQRVQTIPMPGVVGRMDHLGVDVEGGRLFAAALGDTQNTVEVIDVKLGKRTASIRGQSMPQGVFFSPDFKKLFVANGKDGTLKIFNADTFGLLDSLPVGRNADHVGYDQATQYLYTPFTSLPENRWL
jgi:DNA-binding beta-propeller fold protein YncE